jgi:cytochrome c biogenesis factor
MPLPWFTTKGQIIQTILAATIAPILAVVVNWQQIRNNQAFSAVAVLSYILAAMVMTVTIVANRRLYDLRKAHGAEIEALRAAHAAIVAPLEAKLAAHAQAEAILDQIWALRNEARDIKRRWPECLFVKAPLDRIRWSPFVGQPGTGMGGIELEKAIHWHDKFIAYAKGTGDRPYPIHVDFDAVMAMLDRDERLELGLEL